MAVRIEIGLDEELDRNLVAHAMVQWGSTSQAAINQIAATALTELLEECGDIQAGSPPTDEEWQLETLTGCFRIRNGKVKTVQGRLPADRIAETLTAMLKLLEIADDSENTTEGGEP